MRSFKKELGITIVDYINKVRIYGSLQQLRKTEDSILKIALHNGFTSQEYYTETFRKVLGVNPLSYRKFTKNSPFLTEEELSTIRKNLTDLKYQLDGILKYKENVTKNTTKNLTLFR